MKKLIYVLGSCMLMASVWSSCEKNRPNEPEVPNGGSAAEQWASIQGKVSHKETGELLAGVTIELQTNGRQTHTTEDGTYRFDSLKAGKYFLKAQKDGYVDYIKDEILLNANQTTTYDIELEEPFIKFLIVDEAGNAVDELKCDAPECGFKLINIGNITGEWSIESNADWIQEFNPNNGSVEAEGSATITFKRALQVEDKSTVITIKTDKEDLPLKIINRGFVLELVYIEGGEFQMGFPYPDQMRTIRLDGYHIGKFEVTQTQWKAVMGTTPSRFKGENLPVEHVSWEDASEFCQKVSEVTGKNYVLPTEAQWEYAARGGNKSQYYTYAGSNDVKEVAWYGNNSVDRTHPVGTKKANELGIYDMSGNVYEWCSDWYGIYDENDTNNPQGAVSGISRVHRGGDYCSGYNYCRVSNRSHDDPTVRSSGVGFRVAVLP